MEERSLQAAEGGPTYSDSALLPIRHGYGYAAGWVGLAASLFLATVFALSTGAPAIAVPFVAFAALSVAIILSTHNTRYLEADAMGIRLKRGSKVAKEIRWQDMRDLRYGTRVVGGTEVRAREGVFLTVRGRSFWSRIDFDTEGFGVTDAELARFAAQAATLARDHGIPVERRLPHPKTA